MVGRPFAPDGSEAILQPFGHAAVRWSDGSVFAHLHPLGSFSMASQEVFRQRENTVGFANRSATLTSPREMSSSNRVSFLISSRSQEGIGSGFKVRLAGRVLTGVYDLEIKAGT